MWQAITAISIGASLGAVLRWLLSINFNTALPSLQPGTLYANLIGGYLIGIGIAFFGNHPALASEWRLFAITGFLGGLTTFSTFSAEVIALLQSGKVSLACITIATHVIGSLVLTLLGIFTVTAFQSS
ncbi:MAG TPA: fluoride efflux transporter CrcB [Spongiibacteraceae bacterium]|jgi:CrcB protein